VLVDSPPLTPEQAYMWQLLSLGQLHDVYMRAKECGRAENGARVVYI